MVIEINISKIKDVNTIINLRLIKSNKILKTIRVNDYNLTKNLNYTDAFLKDNKQNNIFCLTRFHRNDIWHKRKVFIKLYWLLDELYLEYKFKQIYISDGICNSDNSNIFFSDGERNFNLFTSSIYNVNQVVDSLRFSYPNIEKVGKNKHYLLLIQKIRKLSFIVLCFVYFFKIFFLSIPKKYVGNNVLAISRAYAHKSYFEKFINYVISEKYSLFSFISNVFSKDFWIIFFYIIKFSKQNLIISNLNIEPNSNYCFYELLAKYIQSIPSTFLYLILNKKLKINHIVSGEILTAHSTILYFFAKMNDSKMSIVQTVSLFKDNNFYFNYYP